MSMDEKPTEDSVHRWDCWVIQDPSGSFFHLFRLQASRDQFERGVHHLYSKLAYGTSRDVTEISYSSEDLISLEAGRSVWSGSTIRLPDGQYVIFFTERSSNERTWAHQRIRRAVLGNLKDSALSLTDSGAPTCNVDPLFSIAPENFTSGNGHSIFLSAAPSHARSVHAWRDPFVFSHEGVFYMLVSAKLGSGEMNKAGCITLLRSRDHSLNKWDLVNPALVTGFEELEVAQVFFEPKTGAFVLFASTWSDNDYEESMRRGYSVTNPVVLNVVRRDGLLLRFTAKSFSDFANGIFGEPEIAIPSSERIYAAHIIPELDGMAVGFDVDTGEHKVIPGFFTGLARLK